MNRLLGQCMKFSWLAISVLCAAIASPDTAMAQEVCTARDIVYWESAKECTDAGDVESYLYRFSDGCYVREAQECLARLRERNNPPVRQPGSEFRESNCSECPLMVVVPAGSFVMGSPEGDDVRAEDEGPRRRVTISEPFAVGKFEVTRREFARFVEATGHRAGETCWRRVGGAGWEEGPGYGWRNPGFGQTENDPVVCVNWHDAKAYVLWLSGRTGKRYRLLSEAEWEYAARARTITRYSWGNSIGHNRTNCMHCGSRWDNELPAPVGMFAANGFGLHDMHGNVSEWVEDCWQVNYDGAPSDGSVWSGGNCRNRVVRSGNWSSNDPKKLRSAQRGWIPYERRSSYTGFRIARTLGP